MVVIDSPWETLLGLSLLVTGSVTLTLNVSRKFSMCVIFSTGYINISNNKISNEYLIQKQAFVQ
jgi:hypothetical protein